jgi:1-deoxy-D-xylulose-5-phosphate synthase
MSKLLDQIQTPQDLKKLPKEFLPQLAQEIREEIIQVVAQRGGHLASSLGAVELAIAVHYCFDTPRDKVLWDVGHQAYAHKILTGRRERFKTLRQYGGISGFLRREESPYDVYDSGHSGSSLPIALGMAKARDLKREDYRVIAIIGDGTLSTGMAFEALNCAGAWKTDLIVILNDNEMSISKTVGAISSYLSRIMTGQWVTKMKENLKQMLNEIPGGRRLFRLMKVAEEVLKGLISPGLLFEELGFKYVGPLDGHNLDHLIETFRNVKNLKGPVLIHVLTTKGKGYPLAEKDPVTFHGIGPFDNQNGSLEFKTSRPTYSEVLGKTLVELGEKIPELVAITAAMPHGTGLYEFAKRFPQRFFDVGIAEQAAVSLAAGFALSGLRPVVAIYSAFLQRAYDQIVEEVALPKLPVIFCIDRAGIVGEDGATHHGLLDLSYLRCIPHMTIMAPKDETELKQMIYAAVRSREGPCAIRYPKGSSKGAFGTEGSSPLEWGKMEVLKKGKKVALLAVGSMVEEALETSQILKKEDLYVTVVNVRFVKPLDEEGILQLTSEHDILFALEENVLEGGFGSALLELLSEKGIYKKVIRLGLPSHFVEHGKREELLSLCGLKAPQIAERVRKALRDEKGET